MVFESVVTDVLNKVIGDYVENLDRNQLKIGIWGGDVVLTNLSLRENALDELDLPVQLIYGYLGKLVLKIPWKNLYKQPVVAQIEDFYALVAPKQAVPYDAEKEEKYVLQAKQTALAALDEARKKELEKDKPKADATFTEKLTAQIINNLQVKVANVHIRYEDTTTTGRPFAFGISLYELDFYTTDEFWMKKYLTEQVDRVFKIGNLDSLSAYMNCAGELFSNYDKTQMAQLFRDSIARKDMAPPRFTYVLGPISSVAKLQMNMTPEYNTPPFAMPKIDLCLEMERLNIGLTSTQFQDIIKLMETMNRMQLGMPYRKYRPYNTPYKGHYKEWWNFAITSVLEEDVRKRRRQWTWEYMKQHRHMCNTYAERYKERELSKKPSASLNTTCDLLETKLDLFNLLLIRQRVQIDLEKERLRESEASSAKQSAGWFSSWWGGSKSEAEQEPSNLAKKIEAAMTEEEKNKLYNAIGYEENATPANVPIDYVALSMNFRLEALTFGLFDDEKEQLEAIESQTSIDLNNLKTIALLEFFLASASIKQRPAANAISIAAGVRRMKLIGIKNENYAPTLIESISMGGGSHNLMDVFFETNPLDNQCDKRVRVSTNSLRIVYDAETVTSLMKVFAPPKSVNLSELEGAAASKMANVKQRSATGMKYIIDKRELFEIDIKFQPNVLILPRNGVFGQGEHSMIILSLGALNISSKPDRQRDANIKELIDSGQDIMENILKQAYDVINISIDNIQLLVAKPKEDWQGVLAHATPHEMHVLSPTSIKVDMQMCVIKDDPRLPLNKINILLPAISLHVTEERIFEALEVIFSIPLPDSENLQEAGHLIRTVSSASRLSVASIFNAETKRAAARRNSKKLETAALPEEIIQFTDLEVNFALNTIHVSLIKSCFKECADFSPPESHFGTPTNENDEFHDSISQLEDVTDSPPLSQQKLLALEIKQLEAQFAQRTYDMIACAKLGAISLQQYAANDALKSVDIIDTPRFNEQQQYLLTANFVMTDKKSPEFLTKYNCTEQMLVVKFATLNVILHQEYLLHLLTIADSLQRRFDAICTVSKPAKPRDRMATAADTGIMSTLATIVEERASMLDAEFTTVAQRKRGRHADVVQSIKMHVQAELEQVSLLLTCDCRPLALLKVEQFNTNILLKSSYTELNLGLKNITVTDLNPHTIHTNILSIMGNDVLSCQVVLFNLEQTANYNKDNMKINVEIGCMKIVFLNWFVTSVLNFLNHFQTAVNALAEASAAAAETAKQSAVEAYAKATRMKLNIKMKAPIIVVPVHSQSFDAIALDLGMLVMTNSITELDVEDRDEEDNGPVLDEIKLELRNLKLSKVAILGEDRSAVATTRSVDTTDLAYGLHANLNILDPITFGLTVKRNLSSAWYKNLPELDISGRLKSIELNLFLTDYALIMSILHHNLTEGQDEFEPPEIVTPKTPTTRATQFEFKRPAQSTTATARPHSAPTEAAQVAEPKTAKVSEQLKFSFLFDGIVANLMHGPNDGMARFGIHVLSVKGVKLADGTLSSSVVLCNIQIDDARKNVKSKITKYLCRKDWKSSGFCDESTTTESILERCQKQRNFMLDLTAIIKENDTFAEVRVCGFDLILCVDYLLSLADFFKIPDEILANKSEVQATAAASQTQTQTQAKTAQRLATQVQQKNESKINLMLFIEEPDIILVESLEDINTNAIIFNMQAQLNYRGIGDRQIINGQIDGMKMYMCAFLPERREATKHFIIHPCLISLQGSTPEDQGLHISLNVSNIIINVSPATIELLNKASQTLSANSPNLASLPILKKDYSKIWEPTTFKDRDHWFVKVDPAYDALEMPELEEAAPVVQNKTEKCVLEIPSITLVVEMGVGYYTTPLIMLDTSLQAVISNWSYNLGVKGSLSLSMNYFNQALATWEPIIEPNEIIRLEQPPEYSAWQLNFDVDIENKRSEFDEDVEEKTTRIQIHSEETLEMTMSKTCLDLLGVLSEAFSQAIDPSGLIKPEIVAPYVIENDTGFDIVIDFEHGIFTLHELHMPNSTVSAQINRSLVFKSGQLMDMPLTPEMVTTCQISAGGRAYLQTKDFSKLNSPEDEEYNIYVQLGGIDKKLVLPISKSDTRYFPLYRDTFQTAWGVVSEVRSEHGTTSINLHGVVNVKNHFTTNVSIYRFNSQTKQKALVGVVAAGEVFHVPMHAIYADHKELYFALSGYDISVQGVIWNDTPTDLNYTRQLQCDPESTFEPLYINVVREKTEIYHEHTNKFKLLSAFYTLHLRPPLYLRNALPIGIRVSVAGCSVRSASGGRCAAIVDMLQDSNATDGSQTLATKEDLLDYGEKEVNPGNCLHLPTVKLSSKGRESRSFLVVRLIHYLEKDWSCTTEISEEHETFTLWKFSSYDSAAKMDMDLCVRFEKMHGSLTLIIFSPFWMINKTGLMLSYKSDSETVDVLYHPPEYNGPILFSFRDKFFGGKKRATIRVDNGEWSSKIPLDVAGSYGSVTCNANDMSYQIGVHNYLSYNSLTKQITFIPYYVATNKCKFRIELQEQSRPGDPWLSVEPDACTPIWPKNDSDNMLVARVDELCTSAFRYTETQCTLLKLENSAHGGINVDVHTTEGGTYITFTEYNPGDAPGLLVNHSSKEIVLYEKDNNSAKCVLKKRQKLMYAWHDPVGSKCLVFGKNKVESDLRRDGVGELILEDGSKIYWVSFLDGLQRVLLFTEVESIATKTECSSALQTVTQSIEVRIHGIGLCVVNNEAGIVLMYLGITSSGVIWESKKPNKSRYKQLKINECQQLETQYQQYLRDRSVNEIKNYTFENKYAVDFDRMLLMKSTHREIRRTFYPGVWILMNTSPFQLQLHAKINHVQLDNQLHDCIFPVVLAPIAPPKSVATNMAFKPFIECSIVERVVPNSNVKQYKYATVLIQEFHFKVDLMFLSAIANLFTTDITDEQAIKRFNSDVEMIQCPLSELVATHSLQEHKNFYDNLHLGPLKIHVSFSMAGSDTTALPGLLSTLVEGVGVTLTDVNDVVFRLAYFEREFQFLTQRQLISEISTHYTGQALKQLYVLVLGLDVLGNPYGLVVGLKKGVEDLFYEPFQGAIQGPGEFAEGLVLGVKSLFGHTVGGAAGAFSKITGAMGKGLAALTFDDDYQRKRRQAMNVKPKNFHEGIARSGRGLVMGFVDGVTGVVTKPVTGAREDGVEGFFKGLGKGAVGLVTRPTAGIVDFTSGSLEAVKQATSASDETKRLRAPRFLHQDKVLRPYSRSEANGNKLLKEIERGKYANTDHFVYCEELLHNHEYALLSNHRIIYITKNDLFGTWTVQWSYLWNELEAVNATERGIQLVLKKESKKVFGLFSSNENPKKYILLPSKERIDKFIEQVQSLRSEN